MSLWGLEGGQFFKSQANHKLQMLWFVCEWIAARMRPFLWSYWSPNEKFSFHFLPFRRELRLQGQLQNSTRSCQWLSGWQTFQQSKRLRSGMVDRLSLYSLFVRFSTKPTKIIRTNIKASFASSPPPRWVWVSACLFPEGYSRCLFTAVMSHGWLK